MKAYDPNYKLLDEMYQDNYYHKLNISCAEVLNAIFIPST